MFCFFIALFNSLWVFFPRGIFSFEVKDDIFLGGEGLFPGTQEYK